ncbi:MAG TPA: M28 family peptidase [Bacteroidia bacterium]|jgi:hypothetical protein|nr:M28 family peptidase [Bacteroidia bacterium]
MRSLKFFPFFLFIAVFTQVHGQDRAYAKQVIDTLASPSMHGRGYVNNGDKIAAKYITDQYKSFNLIPFNIAGLYTQNFSFPINTFPGKMSVTIKAGDRATNNLVPGEDFIVQCDAPSVKGHFKVVLIDSALVYDDNKLDAFKKLDKTKCFVMVDTVGVRSKMKLSYMNDIMQYRIGIKGVIIPLKPIAMTSTCNKLEPMDMSQVQSTVPVIKVDYKWKYSGSIDVNIKAKFLKSYTSQNVIGYVRGSTQPDSFIVFTAHYDHLGQMGKDTYFPGANDNASGIAMLLSLARYYSQPAHQPKYSIAFIAFSGEEVGLLGSGFYIQHPLFPLKEIKFLVNMDILGTGDEGITVVNATEFPKQFDSLKALNTRGNYLVTVKPRGKAAISDHYFFTEARVPSFYIYTLGGLKAYHDVCDRRETLPLTKFEDLFSLLRDFTDKMMNSV